MLNSHDGVVLRNDDGCVTPAVKVDTVAAFCLDNRTPAQEIRLRTVSRVIFPAVRQDELNDFAGETSLLAPDDGVSREAKGLSDVQGDHVRAPFPAFGDVHRCSGL
ncbi:MAG: hypothetical protein AB7O77_15230 [Phycisphaerales bacterium]